MIDTGEKFFVALNFIFKLLPVAHHNCLMFNCGNNEYPDLNAHNPSPNSYSGDQNKVPTAEQLCSGDRTIEVTFLQLLKRLLIKTCWRATTVKRENITSWVRFLGTHTYLCISSTQLKQHSTHLKQHRSNNTQHRSKNTDQTTHNTDQTTQVKQHSTRIKQHSTQIKQHSTQIKHKYTQHRHNTLVFVTNLPHEKCHVGFNRLPFIYLMATPYLSQ